MTVAWDASKNFQEIFVLIMTMQQVRSEDYSVVRAILF